MKPRFYKSFLEAWVAGAVNPSVDVFNLMLLRGGYEFRPEHVMDEVMAWELTELSRRPVTNVRVVGSAVLASPVMWADPIAEAAYAVLHRAGGLLAACFDLNDMTRDTYGVEWRGGRLFNLRAQE